MKRLLRPTLGKALALLCLWLVVLAALVALSIVRESKEPLPNAGVTVMSKRGVGRTAGLGTPAQIASLGASWAYSWHIDSTAYNDVYEHVPMIPGLSWNRDQVYAVARAHPGSYWLLWNEPDWVYSKIDVASAAQMYKALRDYLRSVDPTARLVVGNVYYINLSWLRSWRDEYKRLYGAFPVVEGYAAHQYKGARDYVSATWRNEVTIARDWIRSWGAEFWLTEFGCLESGATGEQIMRDQVPWLDGLSGLTRYAWFATKTTIPECRNGTCQGSLLNDDGSLTWLGQIYQSLSGQPTPTPAPPVQPTCVPGCTP